MGNFGEQSDFIAPIGIDHSDIGANCLRNSFLGLEDNPPIRTPGRQIVIDIGTGVGRCQLPGIIAISIHHPNISSTILIGVKGNCLSVGTVGRCMTRKCTLALGFIGQTTGQRA